MRPSLTRVRCDEIGAPTEHRPSWPPRHMRCLVGREMWIARLAVLPAMLGLVSCSIAEEPSRLHTTHAAPSPFGHRLRPRSSAAVADVSLLAVPRGSRLSRLPARARQSARTEAHRVPYAEGPRPRHQGWLVLSLPHSRRHRPPSLADGTRVGFNEAYLALRLLPRRQNSATGARAFTGSRPASGSETASAAPAQRATTRTTPSSR